MKLREKLAESVRGYLESTTIHGFSYLGASKSVVERVAWIFIIVTCFTLASILITRSIDDANKNPVLTTFETVSVKDVPFHTGRNRRVSGHYTKLAFFANLSPPNFHTT